MSDCPDCFKEQRSMNDILKQTIIDAQKYADKKNVKVAVYVDGRQFTFAEISGQIPAATCKIIEPMQ